MLKTEEEWIAGECDQWLVETRLTIVSVKPEHDGLQLYNQGVIAEARQERKDEAKQAG